MRPGAATTASPKALTAIVTRIHHALAFLAIAALPGIAGGLLLG